LPYAFPDGALLPDNSSVAAWCAVASVGSPSDQTGGTRRGFVCNTEALGCCVPHTYPSGGGTAPFPRPQAQYALLHSFCGTG